MRPARFRLVTVTAAAVFTAVLGWRLGWRGDMLAANLCAIIVGLLVDVVMYLRDIQKGRRHTPASQRLADALAAVRPDAEAAVTESARIAAEYLQRALTAEAAIDRVRGLARIAPPTAQGPTWEGLNLALVPPNTKKDPK